MNDHIVPLLILLVVLIAAVLIIQVLSWLRHDGLASRVQRLEVLQQNAAMTHPEARQIYERLASIEGQVQTTNRLMQTVQKHLLENE